MSVKTDTGVYELTGFQRDLLVATRDCPHTGQAIKAELEAAQDRQVTDQRVYANLRRLTDRGFVVKDTHAVDDRSHRYSLTPRGYSALTELREFMADE